MDGKKSLIERVREFFQSTPRGRLYRERLFSLKAISLTFVMIMITVLFYGALFIVIRFVEEFKEPTTQLSVIVAFILGTQLIILIFQTATYYLTGKYSKVEFMPNISIRIKDKITKNARGKIVKTRPFLTVVNTGRDAHNVSVVISVNKKKKYSKKPLFTFRNGMIRRIVPIDNMEAFRASRVDVYVNFEDIVGVFHHAHFIKYPNEDEFITQDTGL